MDIKELKEEDRDLRKEFPPFAGWYTREVHIFLGKLIKKAAEVTSTEDYDWIGKAIQRHQNRLEREMELKENFIEKMPPRPDLEIKVSAEVLISLPAGCQLRREGDKLSLSFMTEKIGEFSATNSDLGKIRLEALKHLIAHR